MPRIRNCCGAAPAEAEKLPSRVPREMAEAIQRNTQLTLKEIQGLYDGFRKYAPNGRLLFARFCDTLGVLGMLDDTMIPERMFRAFDLNKDRELSFIEFATALGIMMCGTDDQKLDLAFRILNPTYTGMGKCLDDYRHHSLSLSDSSYEAPPSHSLSDPSVSGEVDSNELAVEDSSDDWKAAVSAPGPNQGSQLEASEGQRPFDLKGGGKLIRGRDLLGSSCRQPGDMRWLSRYRDVIYADSLGLEDFLDLVRCLQASRRALLGGEGVVVPDEEIATVFLPLASEMPDGSRRMMLNDFKRAVHTSQHFLFLLGVTLNQAPNAFPHAEPAPPVKSEPKVSIVPTPCTAASPSAAEVRANVRAELLHRIRQMEANAEVQQRKQQQQQRLQLEQLAASLRTVGRDVETVKNALTTNATSAPSETKRIDSSAVFTIDRRGHPCSGPLASWHLELESSMEPGSPDECTEKLETNEKSCQGLARTVVKLETAGKVPRGTQTNRSRIVSSEDLFAQNGGKTPAAAAAAAAAALAELEQAEQQLNRILEEINTALNPPVHLTDQLLMGMGSTCSSNAPAQESTKEAGLPALIVSSESPRQNRVSFLVQHDTEESERKPTAQDAGGSDKEDANAHFLQLPKPDAFSPKDALTDSKLNISNDMVIGDSDGQRRASTPYSRRMYMNRATVYQRRPTQWRIVSSDIIPSGDDSGVKPSNKTGKETKGSVVHFGHESWNTVINIMMGIRMAGGRAMSEPQRAIEPYDFVMKEKFSVLPKTGMVDRKRRQTSLRAVRFIDYAPMVFRRLRAIFGIDSLLYIRSVGPDQLLGNLILGNLSSLSELVSEGRSGSLFYYTTDGRFMIKTISREMALFMRSVLFDYYKHVSTYTSTMLTRFCGLHAIRLKDKSGHLFGLKEPWRRKTYFMVMENFFHTPVEVHRRYDLKGSTNGRSLPPELLEDAAVARKDNDMTRDGEMIELGEERKKLFIGQLAVDASFLRDHGIMDYSLLLGISYANRSQDSKIFQNSVVQIDDELQASHSVVASSNTSMPGSGAEFEPPFWSRDLGGMWSIDRTKLYYVGIIDILTHWNAKKKLEHVARVMEAGNATTPSCVNPTLYSQRFVDFITRHTV